MSFAKLIPPFAIASLALSCAACNGAGTMPPVTGCSELARTVLGEPTPHAELGDSGDPALDWQLYGTAETGQLNKANDDKATGLSIIQGCERRDEEVRRRASRPAWWPF